MGNAGITWAIVGTKTVGGLREGLPVTCFNDKELAKAREFPGLIDVSDQRVTVTEAGRLLADGMIADILVMGES